jgi:hypothetical protein
MIKTMTMFKIIERLSVEGKDEGEITGNGRTSRKGRQQMYMVRTSAGFPCNVEHNKISCGILINEV